MTCKNCDSSLRSDFTYCPSCGAKIIRNRLTLKNIWQDLSFQVFNLDNTLFKTFRDLFYKPEIVIESFTSGIRKKYINPISYFAIAVTISGILFFILRDVYEIRLLPTNSSNGNNLNMDFIYDYQGFMSYLFLPYYALATWILFLDKRKMNYTEHFVANSYVTAQAFIVQAMICIPLFGLLDVRYDVVNWGFLGIMTIYLFYVLGKIHHTGFFNTLWRGLAYVVFFLIFSVIFGVAVVLFMLFSGQMNLEDFAPK